MYAGINLNSNERSYVSRLRNILKFNVRMQILLSLMFPISKKIRDWLKKKKEIGVNLCGGRGGRSLR